MKQQGRNLTIRIQGKDVTLLHTELKVIGFSFDDREVAAGMLGLRTKERQDPLMSESRFNFL